MTAQSRRATWDRAIAFESGVWRSLGGWILRRPVAKPGETAHSYFGAMRTNYLIFIGISAIEIPALHFLIPWPTARFILVLIGVWGLIWCLGLLASMTRHPHLTSSEGLRLRYGATVDVLVPWDQIDVAALRPGFASEGRVVQVVGPPEAPTLQLAIANQTNFIVRLRGPLDICLPAGPGSVSSATFYADDPGSLLAAVKQSLH